MRSLVLSCKLCLLGAILWTLIFASAPGAASIQASLDCVVTDSGDLLEEISAISSQLPWRDSDGMLVPTTAQMAAWEQLIEAISTLDLASACTVIQENQFPYQIVRYTDQGYDGSTYMLLKENLPISVGWGTYLLDTDGQPGDLVIEVPHPRCEWNTESLGIELFRQAEASAFLMAGTHRCANSTYSPCDGTTTFCGQEEPHRTSDVAHSTTTIFHATHRALILPGTSQVAVQIHGCSDSSCPDLFISNGTCSPTQLAQRFYRNALAACQDFAIDLADCSPSQCSLVGTTNLQGRYSNGVFYEPAFDPCTEPAPDPASPGQFLHLEQSAEFRGDFSCLVQTLKMTFSTRPEAYLPVVVSRDEPRDGQPGITSSVPGTTPDELDQRPATLSGTATISDKPTSDLIQTSFEFH